MEQPRLAVQLGFERPDAQWQSRLSAAVSHIDGFHGDVRPALTWAADVGQWAPQPGGGTTVRLWELLATVAAADVGVARVLEPHLDALAILDQAQEPVALADIGADARSTWGVYAAEGPAVRVDARQQGVSWVLNGVKPWCSLAGDVSHALVTAHTSDGSRRLFAVNMASDGVEADTGPWVSRGLRQVVSAPVRFTHAVAVPVGEDNWYLKRPGFQWGGAGVAACWYGGAVGIARALYSAAGRREPDQIALVHLGAVDAVLHAARSTLALAAECCDDPALTDDDPAITARRSRNVVADAVEQTLLHAAHGLGPGPLTADEDHARRVADLQIYVRQHHAERDEAALGRDLAAAGRQPW